MAIDALVALADERLGIISATIADADELWSDRVARSAVLTLFPNFMSVEQLCRTLRWIKREKRNVGDLSWQLPRLIAEVSLEFPVLEELRDGLISLGAVDLCCTHFIQQYIGSHIIVNASDTILA